MELTLRVPTGKLSSVGMRKLSEEPDLVVGSGRSATKYKMDLIPPALVVARFFAEQQSQAAGQMHGEQQDEDHFARLDQRLLGPGEERIQLQRIAQRPEMEGKEDRQRACTRDQRIL
jgi:hypothetical protein